MAFNLKDLVKRYQKAILSGDQKAVDRVLAPLTNAQGQALAKVFKENPELFGFTKVKDTSSIPDDPASFAEKYSRQFGGSQGRDHIWRRAKHLELLNTYLVEIANGKRRRVMVSMPPRHGKTELVTYWNTLWRLAKNPATRIALCGYSAGFIERYGRWIRNFIRDHGKEIGVELDPSSTAAHSWQTTAGGGVHTVGRGGPISGMGFDLIIVDDPYKGFAEANSEVIREEAWSWWTGEVFARKEARTAYLIIQTRWHFEDISGKLERMGLAEGGLPWDVIKLKALAEPGDPLGRPDGEPLWPEGIPLEELLDTKKVLIAPEWSALFQQEPIPGEGNLFPFTWWRYWDSLPAQFDLMIQSWDFSFKDAKKSDYVVGQVWGRLGANFYLVDQIRGQLSAKDSITAIRNFTKRYPQARAKLFEDKANGPALKSLLNHEVGGIIPINPKGNKAARAAAIQMFVQAGNVHLPTVKDNPWVNDFLIECGQFPNGSKDDQVDAMTQAINYMAPGGMLVMDRYHSQASGEAEHRMINPLESVQRSFWRTLGKQVKETVKEQQGKKAKREDFSGNW